MCCIGCRYSRCGEGRCVKYQPYMLPNEEIVAILVPIQRHNGDPWRIIYIVALVTVGEASGNLPGTGFAPGVASTGASGIWRMRGMATGTDEAALP